MPLAVYSTPHMEKGSLLSALCLFRDVLRSLYHTLTADYRCDFAELLSGESSNRGPANT